MVILRNEVSDPVCFKNAYYFRRQTNLPIQYPPHKSGCRFVFQVSALQEVFFAELRYAPIIRCINISVVRSNTDILYIIYFAILYIPELKSVVHFLLLSVLFFRIATLHFASLAMTGVYVRIERNPNIFTPWIAAGSATPRNDGVHLVPIVRLRVDCRVNAYGVSSQ